MKIVILLILLGVLGGASDVCGATNQIELLTLDQALEMAERRHPQLAETRALIEAASGRAQQAGTFPNPEAILGAQQIPVQSYPVPDRQYVAGFGQTIPLGNRLAKAREAELLDREIRLRGLESVHRQLRKRVHGSFATALYQESAFQAQSRITAGLGSMVAVTKARLDAGDVIPQDLARSEMELARAEVELRRSESLRKQGLIALAAAVGDPDLEVKSVEGNLEVAFEVPTLDALAANLSTQPELQAAEAGVRASSARIALAKAERIPDVKVEALYHRLEVSEQNTFDLGMSFPLPLFNRNQGKLREARSEALAAEARVRNTANELNLNLRESYVALTNALDNLKTFRNQILPRAEIILKSAELRYASGDSALTDVLPVRRDWAAEHLSYLETLREVMLSWAEVSSFLGQTTRR
ncbi:MAG: putative metal ion efflux outer membrane protein [Verrucomicrobiota bacterium]|jgi:cobalt-zinc-cadmium efflux system outer membrane protein